MDGAHCRRIWCNVHWGAALAIGAENAFVIEYCGGQLDLMRTCKIADGGLVFLRAYFVGNPVDALDSQLTRKFQNASPGLQ